jgi:hypothetical protein
MSNPNLSTKEVIELVQAAIDRIKWTKEEFARLNADPTVGPHRLASFKMTVDAAVGEFGMQWGNVARLLAEGKWGEV